MRIAFVGLSLAVTCLAQMPVAIVAGTPPAVVATGLTLLAHGAQSCAGSSCTTPTVTINSTGATLLTIVDSSAGNHDPSTDTINDSKGNTWHASTSVISSITTVIWRAYDKAGSPLSVGPGQTIGITGGYVGFSVQAWSGTLTSPTDPYDKQSNNSSAANVSSLTYPSTTCSQAHSLLLAAAGMHIAGTYSIDTGFTLIDTVNFVSGNTAGMGAAYLVQTSTAAVAPTWTSTGTASTMAMSLDCFKGN